jgi:hypothetical protein
MALISASKGTAEVLKRIKELLQERDINPCIVMDGEDCVAFKDEKSHDQYVLKLIKCEE